MIDFLTVQIAWKIIFRFFFFDLYKSPIFEILLLLTCQANNTMIFGFAGFDGLFYAIGLNITGHFKILQTRIRQMKFKKEDIEKITFYQNEIYQCCAEFRDIFAPALIAIIVYSTIMICFLGFQIVVVIMVMCFWFWRALCKLTRFLHSKNPAMKISFK